MASRDLIFIRHLVDCYKNSCLGVPLSVPAMTRPCVLCSHLAFPPQVAYTGLATLSFRKICFAIKTPDCALLTVMIALCVFFLLLSWVGKKNCPSQREVLGAWMQQLCLQPLAPEAGYRQ